ncbi:FUSC family protein [Clostridium rectalis]|uniref:FUSC family protein n=1 Tax=Clostridium rectalis TaxID=2040295 RepID=UPI000F632809|nr:aromatic acid exporter family protein [Clostridium rectalis]
MQRIDSYSIKVAISVSLCIVLFNILHREYPFYACIAAISCMKESVSSTCVAGKNRFFGTCIGALMGLIFYLFLKDTAIYCGIGIIIIVYLCRLFKHPSSIVISCIVFVAIMTNLKGVPSQEYAIDRIINTFIGIIIAALVDKITDYILNSKIYTKSNCKSESK